MVRSVNGKDERVFGLDALLNTLLNRSSLKARCHIQSGTRGHRTDIQRQGRLILVLFVDLVGAVFLQARDEADSLASGQMLILSHDIEERLHADLLVREVLLDLFESGIEHGQIDHQVALVGSLGALLDQCLYPPVLGLAPLQLIVDLFGLVFL